MAFPNATLVAQFNNYLRYLLTGDGTAGPIVIDSAGGVTPDLQTDSLAGPIKQIARAKLDGIGTIAAGTNLTQAQARALWLSDATVSVGNTEVARTITRVTPRTGLTTWLVDANQNAGNPTITIAVSAVAGTAYLDIVVPGAIGA